MSEETARSERNGKQQAGNKHAWRYRIIGVLLGLAITLVGAGTVLVQGVQTVEATGLVGTRGSFTVKYCYEDGGAKWSDHRCRGTFAPRAAQHSDREGTLENADDEAAGTRLDVVEGSVGESAFRETGVLATLGSLMWLCFGLLLLPWGFFTTRKWVRGTDR